ncbi:cation:proton antiporter regulatory subunit [Halalkalicoccus tibetensis]|uniref:Cation:proton antiporter regulatory subunit n=1 Tax=Halalkalicoccus tibetensis TaxID=175632 RepID=A0ABD5VA00_9EURY
MPFEIEETTLPGVGKRYEMYLNEDRSIAVVIQSNGSRQVFCRDDPSEDYEEVMELTDPQARTLGLFLVGAYYQPVAARLSEETARGEHIEWYAITENSPIQHMNKSDMERKTGVKILGVDRDGEIDSVPGDDFDFKAGDRLMVIGTDETHDKLNAVLRKI